MKIRNLFLSLIILIAFSCTDGTQMGQQINQLILDNEIESIIVEMETNKGKVQKNEYSIHDDLIENQFIKLDKEYINIGSIKTMKIKGNKLEIKL